MDIFWNCIITLPLKNKQFISQWEQFSIVCCKTITILITYQLDYSAVNQNQDQNHSYYWIIFNTQKRHTLMTSNLTFGVTQADKPFMHY